MTHVYAYIKNEYSEEQIGALIQNLKKAVSEGLSISGQASTIAVKELEPDCYCDHFGAVALVYTAKGKGIDVKKRFARLLYEAFTDTLGDALEVKMVMKEQANDMIGVNGILRCNAVEVNTVYEVN